MVAIINNPKSPDEKIGDPRSISGRRSYEAKYKTKLDLSLQMIQSAFQRGIRAGYVLFDSWYAWPVLINDIRKIDEALHVIYRLKDTKVLYEYKGKPYRLSELYQKVKPGLKKDSRTGLLLKRVTVTYPGSDAEVVIVFSKGYQEPEDPVKGKKKQKERKWLPSFPPTPGCMYPLSSRSTPNAEQLRSALRKPNNYSDLGRTKAMISMLSCVQPPSVSSATTFSIS